MIESFIRKWLFTILFLITLLFLGIFTFNTFLNYQQSHNTQQAADELRKANAREDGKNTLYEAQEKIAVDKSKGYQGKYQLLEWETKKGYLGIDGVKDEEGIEIAPNITGEKTRLGSGVLKLNQKTKKHFIRILQDIDDWLADGKLKPLPRLSASHNYPTLVRNNCVLYGAPGTGKTEFVNELSHVLIDRYGEGKPIITQADVEDINGPYWGWKVDPKEQAEARRGIKNPTIPIFLINGLELMSTGVKGEPNTHKKLVACVKKAKKDFFKDENSDKPYIVFIDEGDQAKNPLTYDARFKNNLEEFKNFFSTSAESGGIAKDAQDRNSVFIIATNNYDTIDPGMLRWGRLGISLNFTWSPEIIKIYGESPSSIYRISWPKNSQPDEYGDDDHYCWKFGKNEDRAILFEIAKQINFHNYEAEFVPKTNEILEKWKRWKEKDKDDFAISRLGLESKKWCPTCEREVNEEKISQKRKRIEEILEDITDKKEREKIKREEMEKRLGECGHEYKPIANWLLHYLHTFFDYSRRNDLDGFDHPNKIERYKFNEPRLLRERINQLRMDLNDMGQEWTNIFGAELRNIGNQLQFLVDAKAKGQEDVQAISTSVDELNDKINEKLATVINKL